MTQRPLWLFLGPVIFFGIATGLYICDFTRVGITRFIADAYFFVKEHIIAILTAFFLVKGKFVIQIFLRKIILLSATGLGKRYMIEKVLNHQIKVHFLDHMQDDFKRLTEHIKHNFQEFPLIKKIMTGFAFLGSLGFMGKFMGGMLAVKVFIAKIWSFLLLLFLKTFSWLFYFLTKVVWGSWIAPILEVFLFSWLLEWMEKLPFLKHTIQTINNLFRYLFGWVEKLIARLMRAPLRRFLKWLVRTMKIAIYKFIGYERVSLYKRLQESRHLHLNAYELIQYKRKSRERKSMYISGWEQLKEKRERRKPMRQMNI